MPNTELSEAMRAIANKRWKGTTEAQRRAHTAAATAARKSAAQRIAELEARLGSEIDRLNAEVADLRQRVAA
jgi:hypothetical protein